MATRINWDRDAGDGGLSSNGVLLLWLARPGNYTRWRSPPARNRAATEVVEEMQAHGLHYHTCTCQYLPYAILKIIAHAFFVRPTAITRGISRLITTYRYTGERYRRYYGREPPASPRMTPESGWESAEAELLQLCRHWYTLDAIMGNSEMALEMGNLLD
ncbi:hypothetical protein PSTT_09086 [Puccinia striiformis]|uniref:Uncharacterized protein n=1 Tax=Puccinia striiformis TaxID=27350 RepID=A0A2S4V9H5_9BASI|nr:hypothetical protein PSTT_09086 [Puccinia striiformis]